ncbi:UNVERIFIED_CONTAM: hypothetical protein Sradi_0966200 [Sesamum radiatum]|uniref:Uncharacterized protein n=1 Tax=Sesamum radiatum TaxID=300843 RepID=A0AAW2V3V0_SESRA
MVILRKALEPNLLQTIDSPQSHEEVRPDAAGENDVDADDEDSEMVLRLEKMFQAASLQQMSVPGKSMRKKRMESMTLMVKLRVKVRPKILVKRISE